VRKVDVRWEVADETMAVGRSGGLYEATVVRATATPRAPQLRLPLSAPKTARPSCLLVHTVCLLQRTITRHPRGIMPSHYPNYVSQTRGGVQLTSLRENSPATPRWSPSLRVD
jgi:hypothetical protein